MRRIMLIHALYFKWTEKHGLNIWQSWIDDCMNTGCEEGVKEACEELMNRFTCEDEGPLKEYVGCKVDRGFDSIRLTQPVMIQSFQDEFDLSEVKSSVTPGEPGKVLPKNEDDEAKVKPSVHSYFRRGIGKLLHMMRWSRPEVQNSVRDASRHLKSPTEVHVHAMHRIMKYVVDTPDRGWYLKPERKWNGKDRNFRFVIAGKSDSDGGTCPATRRSVTGYSVFLEGAPIMARSVL